MGQARKLIRELFDRIVYKKAKQDTGGYIGKFDTIEELVDDGLLAIDFKELFVSIDSNLHLLLCNEDKKYLVFFDTVLAYINFNRGYLCGRYGESLPFVNPDTAQINFIVIRDTESHPLLIGWIKQGKLKYVPWEDEKNEIC